MDSIQAAEAAIVFKSSVGLIKLTEVGCGIPQPT
jgi:hypothetical protein